MNYNESGRNEVDDYNKKKEKIIKAKNLAVITL